MKKISIIIILFFILSACEKTVTIDIPQKPSKLVINAWIGKDSLIALHVGKSRYSLAPQNVSGNLLENYTVKNAVPVIFENGVPIDTLVYFSSEYKYRSVRNKRIRQGNTYVVKVTAPGFTEAQSETLVPSQSEIASLQRVRNARTTSNGELEDEITLKINDPASEKNFYLVQVFGAAPGPYAEGWPVPCVKNN